MNGIMLGLSPREARRRVDSVIEFAELQEFKDLKLKNYSSGMQVRLAFSVAIQVDADILMIDEVLAVGDAELPAEVLRRLQRPARPGQDDHLRHPRHGRDAALLSPRDADGARRPAALGEPHEVAERYLELNFGREAARSPTRAHAATATRGSRRCGSRTQRGERLTSVPQGTARSRSGRGCASWSTSLIPARQPAHLQRRAPRGDVASTLQRERAHRRVPRRRGGRLLLHVRQRARARPLQRRWSSSRTAARAST